MIHCVLFCQPFPKLISAPFGMEEDRRMWRPRWESSGQKLRVAKCRTVLGLALIADVLSC